MKGDKIMNAQDIESRKAIKALILQLTSILDIQVVLFKLIVPVSPEMSSAQKDMIQKMIDQTKSSLNLLRKNLEALLPS
jgi:hypothetical protein